jgi:hypothetical protein
MLVLHIRDLLFRFIGIIVDLRLFTRLIRFAHVTLSLLPVVLFVLIGPVRFLALLIWLIHILVLLVALLRLLWFVFLFVHIVILDR